MNEPKTSPEQAPGHYGAGYGEQVPAEAPPRPAPKTDADPDAPGTSPARPIADAADSSQAAGTTSQGDDGAPVVFTPDDVGVRPPDHPPTESAPESEKAGLIFERS
jgi:hypothetical protein